MDFCKMKAMAMPTLLVAPTRSSEQIMRETTPRNLYNSCCLKNDRDKCKLPIIANPNCGGKGKIPELPRIPKQDLLRMFRYGQEEKKMLEDVTQKEIFVNELTVNLKTVKEAIEKTFSAQMETQAEIEKGPPREEIEMLLELKCTQQHELMECLKLEEKYLHDLNCAQRAMRECRLKKQSLNLQMMDNQIDEVYNSYEAQKGKMYRQRFYRECNQKSAMHRYKHQAIKNYLDTSIDKVIQKHDEQKKPKVLGMKDAMKKIRYHIRNTNLRRRKLKDETQLTQQMRQYHQKQTLLALKTKMDDHREWLHQQQEKQKKKKEREAKENEKKRQALIDEGENPYVIDEMIRFQDKIKKGETKAIESKHVAMNKIENEIRRRELDSIKSKESRRKWDQFWAKKARDKKIQNYNQFIKPFLSENAQDGDGAVALTDSVGASRTAKWFKIAQDMYGYEEGKEPMKCPPGNSGNIPPVPIPIPIPITKTIKSTFPRKKSLIPIKISMSATADPVTPEVGVGDAEEEEDVVVAMKETNGSSFSGSNKGTRGTKSDSIKKKKRSKDNTNKRKSKRYSSEIVKSANAIPGRENRILDEYAGEEQELFEEKLNTNQVSSPPKKYGSTTFLYPMDCEMPLAGYGPGGDAKVQFLNSNTDLHGTNQKPLFSWIPKIISFKNYEVGKVYKMRVFVVNKSNRRLKYYYKEIIDGEVSGNGPKNPPPTAIILENKNRSQPDSLSSRHNSGLEIETPSIFTELTTASTVKTTPDSDSKREDEKASLSLLRKKSKMSARSKKTVESPQSPSLQKLNDESLDELAKAGFYKLSDLINVNFTVPSPLSPGLKHSFVVTFKPIVSGDWSGYLSFFSQDVTFSIPVEVSKKRFSPVLMDMNDPSSPSLVIPRTVVGISTMKKVRLKNTGGLPGHLVTVLESNPPKNFTDLEVFYVNQNSNSSNSYSMTNTTSTSILSVSGAGGSLEVGSSKIQQFSDTEDDDVKKSNVSFKHSVKKGEIETKPKQHKGGKNKAKSTASSSSSGSKKKSSKAKKSLAVKSKSKTSQKSVNSPKVLPATSKTSSVKNIPFSSLSKATKDVKDILSTLITYVTESIFVQYVDEMKRDMKPGEELHLSVVYRPPFVSSFTTKYYMSFEPDSPIETAKGESVEDIILDVAGVAAENPVYIQPANADFQICMINNTYQQIVSVHTNCSKGMGKVIAKVPPLLKDFVDVHPRGATSLLQSQPAEFSIKFTPTKSILIQSKKFKEYFDPKTNIMDFPIYFELKFPYNVPSPIRATFMAVLSNTSLDIDPLEIDMGECLPNETVKNFISIHNPTLLPQKIGFVDVPEEVMIHPNYGIGTVLPGERVNLDVLVSLDHLSNSQKNYRDQRIFQMKLVTMAKEEYDIRVKCFVKNTSIRLSPTKITFPATCCGSIASSNIFIKTTNPSSKGLSFLSKFQVDVDPEIPIKIVPECGYVEPGKETKLSVTFEANVSEEAVIAEYTDMAKKRYLERKNTYQRELSSINLHLQNDWMLDENSNPDILNFRTSLEYMNMKSSTSELSEALKKIALRKILKPPSQARSSSIKSQEVEVGTGTTDDDQKSTASNNADDIDKLSLPKNKKFSESSKKSSVKSTSNQQKLKKSNAKKRSLNRNKNVRDSTGEEGSSAGRVDSNSKKMSGSISGNSNIPIKQQLLGELEKRKKLLVSKIEEAFVPPSPSDIPVDSGEFIRAKRDLLKNMSPTSSVYQIPIHIYDRPSATPTDVFYVTLKCPIQKPDLVLLDDSALFDFGPVPVHTMAWKEISVYNVSRGILKLNMSVLNPLGPFVQSNALRPLAPEHVYTLKIRFEPTFQDKYEEVFSIYGGESCIEVTLVGSGDSSQPSTAATTAKDSLSVQTAGTAENSGEASTPITNPELTLRTSSANSSLQSKGSQGKKRRTRKSVKGPS